MFKLIFGADILIILHSAQSSSTLLPPPGGALWASAAADRLYPAGDGLYGNGFLVVLPVCNSRRRAGYAILVPERRAACNVIPAIAKRRWISGNEWLSSLAYIINNSGAQHVGSALFGWTH